MAPTKNSIPAATRKKIAALLAPLLSDAQDLYSQTKQAHWNVRSPAFTDLHELFDTIATEVSDDVDLIAERIVQLGEITEGTIRFAAKKSRLKEHAHVSNDPAKHV